MPSRLPQTPRRTCPGAAGPHHHRSGVIPVTRTVAESQHVSPPSDRKSIDRSTARITTRILPHTATADTRRLLTTDAVMNGMPPHIAQLVLG